MQMFSSLCYFVIVSNAKVIIFLNKQGLWWFFLLKIFIYGLLYLFLCYFSCPIR